MEKEFNKYKERGSTHWREMMSRDIRKFNAAQQSRYDWIIKMAGDISGHSILDLGCGDGSLTYLIAKKGGIVTGVDNNELGIKFAEENLQNIKNYGNLIYNFIVASAYEVPFPDDSFDVVVCCEVIEHVHDPEKLIREAHRVLKPSGKFILTTPYRLSEKPSDVNHIREYFPGELETIFKKFFRSVEIKLFGHIFWTGLYTYSFGRFRHFSTRHFGKLLINAFTLWFGRNPFMIDYPKPGKYDRFSRILIRAKK